MMKGPDLFGGLVVASLFWSLGQRSSWRLGSLVYETNKELRGRRTSRTGSPEEAIEKLDLTTLERTVVAG